MRENTTSSNRVLPKNPSVIRHVTKASQRPVVGSALNWQGQPQSQLQLANSSPAIRHLILVGSPMFLLLHLALPPMKKCHVKIGLWEECRTKIYSARVRHIARFSRGIFRKAIAARQEAFRRSECLLLASVRRPFVLSFDRLSSSLTFQHPLPLNRKSHRGYAPMF